MFKKVVPFLIIPLFMILLTLFGFLFPNVAIGILLGFLILPILYLLSYLSFLMFGEKMLGKEEYNRLIEKMGIF